MPKLFRLTARDALVSRTREVAYSVSMPSEIGDGIRRSAPALRAVLFFVDWRENNVQKRDKQHAMIGREK